MQFTCESCRTVLQIADEKVRGKRLLVRCKRCGAKIAISDPALAPRAAAAPPAPPATLPPAAASAPAPSPSGPGDDDEESTRAMDSEQLARALQESKGDDGPRRAQPSPAPPRAAAAPARAPAPAAARSEPPPPAPTWFAMVGGRQTGPMTRSELTLRTAQGVVNGRTYVWREGMDSWLRAKDVAELGGLFGEGAPAEAARPAAVRPATSAPAASPGHGPSERAGSPTAEPRYEALFSGESRGRRGAPLVVAAVVILALVSVVVFWMLRQDARRSAARAAAAREEAAAEARAAADAGAASRSDAGIAPSAPPPFAAERVLRRADESRAAYRSCVAEAARKGDRSLRRIAKLQVAVLLAPDGSVQAARIEPRKLDRSPVAACVKRATRAIHFDPFSGAATEVAIPIPLRGEK